VPFSIPNSPDTSYPDQAEPDKRDFQDIILPGFGMTGVQVGCAVTAQATPDMTVAVSAGTVVKDGMQASVTAGNLTIGTADSTNPRFDLICVDSTGAKSVVAGTASSNPVFPDPAGKVVLAAVYVPAGTTAITNAHIVDKRVMLPVDGALALSGQYLTLNANSLGTQTPGINALQATTPLWLPAGVTLTRIGCKINTAGSAGAVVRLGIYRADAPGLLPGTLILDAGTVDSTTTGVKEIVISTVIPTTGWYWLATVSQVATSGIAAYNPPQWPLLFMPTTSNDTNGAVVPFRSGAVSGPLPDPFGAIASYQSWTNPKLFVKVG
jgi:hypothetical protein